MGILEKQEEMMLNYLIQLENMPLDDADRPKLEKTIVILSRNIDTTMQLQFKEKELREQQNLRKAEMLTSSEETEAKNKLEKKKIQLENAKLDFQIKESEARWKLDIEKLDLDKKKHEEESKRLKKEAKWGKVKTFIEIGVPVLTYGGLALMDMNYERKEDGRTPSRFKNLMNKIKTK